MALIHQCLQHNDAQMPYRFPITADVHGCPNPHCITNADRVMVEAAQVAQDAQAGYACDSCTKRQQMAFNEVR